MPFLLLLSSGLVACGGSSSEPEVLIEEESGAAPHLAFSDLISGPSTGIGDELGSGTIVTVWGFELGSEQAGSTLEYCDVNSSCAPMAHVYYWKNADGQLPSGPANLYESHGMQEISFSIPEAPAGAGEIRLSNAHGTSSLPFTVRPGEIYHVKEQGDDENGDGSFSNPWQSVAHADQTLDAGATL